MNKNMLKAAIMEAGYTQTSLAKEMGISKNTLSAKINGKSKMFTDEICLLCDLLRITDDKKKIQIFLSNPSHFRDTPGVDDMN